MAYNVYVACDMCGETLHLSCNKTMSIGEAIRIAKLNDWDVERIGNISNTSFYCPKCAYERKMRQDD